MENKFFEGAAEKIKGFISDKKEVYTFRGGIHPDAMKEETKDKPIVDIDAPQLMIFPMVQHLGAPATPIVQVGDEVKVGQKIAEASGYVSANIHSSVSGTVKEIKPSLHPNGTEVECIFIENDGRYEVVEGLKGYDYRELSPKEIVDIVREAGIVGMGGACFPTHVKLNVSDDKRIDYVIVNGAECEPYLTSDHRQMLENPKDVITGLKILMKIFGLTTGYIGIEENKPDAIEVLQNAASLDGEADIRIVTLKTKYPQGSEKQLIDAITGRKIPPGKLPADVGAIVDNVDTVASICRAVTKGRPLISRIVTVAGDCIGNPVNFRVRIGTPFNYIVEKAGGFKKEPRKVIMGGPMMGIAQISLDTPVVKGTSGLLAFGRKFARAQEETTCLRCGKCVEICPMRLVPLEINNAYKRNDFDALMKLNVMDCIECGSCSYICQSSQRVVQNIRIAKAKIREKK